MNDDIVTRLRAGNGDDIVLFGMMYEAADEIERLRIELDRAKKCVNDLQTAVLNERENTVFWYKQAVRND